MEIENLDAAIHETTDHRVVIIEIETRGTSLVTGRPYRLGALGVITVRDGEIVSYRDYMNPIAVADVFGRTPELAAALSAENP